jgi:hypothetical protein
MRLKPILGFLFAATLVLSCQTAEVNRLKDENDSLKTSRNEISRERDTGMEEITALKARIENRDKTFRDLESRLSVVSGDFTALKNKWDLLMKDYAVLKDESLRLMTTLDEINFAQSMLLSRARTGYEGQKYDISEKPAESAPAADKSAPPAAKTVPVVEPIYGVIKKNLPGGKTEYFDALANHEMDRGFYLSFEDRAEGILLLKLNVAYSYSVVPAGSAVRIIGLGLAFDGRIRDIPFSPGDSRISDSDGYRKEIVSLPVFGSLADNLKAVFAAGTEVRVIHVFPDYSRERIVTPMERRALLNVLFAYQDMGGRLQ